MNERSTVLRTLSVIAAIVVAGLTPAQDKTELPAVEEIIAAHVEAIGGEKAFLKYDSRRLEGTLSMPAAGLSGDITLYAMAPNRTLVEVEMEGVGTIREGFDGEVAWSTDPMTGPQLKTGDQLLQAKDQSFYRAGLFPTELYATREVLDKVEFDGRPAWKVRVVTENGNESIVYFDAERGMQIGMERTQKTPMGDIAVTVTFHDYQEFDGMRLPTRIVNDMGPAGQQVMEFTRVTGGGVDASVFALPPEIRALRE